MKNSTKLIERRHAVVAQGVGMFAGQTTAVSASGARILDADGDEYIDFAGGIGVMNVGHCNPEVVAAIHAQAGKLLHASIHVATYEPYVALCEELVRLLPHGESTKAMLVNSGAEAVENAIKIARQATGRAGVVCFDGGFHGRTLLAMTLTGKSAYKLGCGPFAPEIYRVPFPSAFHEGHQGSEQELVEQHLSRFEERFVRGPIAASEIAAIIIEPVQGEAGFVVAPPAYLRGLRELCDRHGIMLIFDEVQSGFCRSGHWAAFQHANVTPDLSTWAKSLGGGLPIAAVLGRAHVMDAALPGTIGGTYGGNPVACAAAMATLKVMEREQLGARARVIGDKVRASFEGLRDHCNVIGEVRGLGAMIAIELSYAGDPTRPAPQVTAAAVARCRTEGVLVITAGAFANIIRTLSPLVISDADLDRGLTVIKAAIIAAAKEHGNP
ncbi:Gamma-aminobutyrate:alpha-ketoglutarate aminotransferase [Enhygromyxa salina]|uniref:Gamma-aminobutyrate:alpha-ketoglutarate aminotransferase n=1 Tax=Enhygromyxa salina TaxID=215803 RepID=A0A0C1ZU44_9BACT|nr:aspartate aminotransferase family protein [Enhygromyxa salina]KIG14578.1 Gamma-aminobutyrate:alpha-ketoglutarate aminotransferase [Enhygromyxa salina]